MGGGVGSSTPLRCHCQRTGPQPGPRTHCADRWPGGQRRKSEAGRPGTASCPPSRCWRSFQREEILPNMPRLPGEAKRQAAGVEGAHGRPSLPRGAEATDWLEHQDAGKSSRRVWRELKQPSPPVGPSGLSPVFVPQLGAPTYNRQRIPPGPPAHKDLDPGCLHGRPSWEGFGWRCPGPWESGWGKIRGLTSPTGAGHWPCSLCKGGISSWATPPPSSVKMEPEEARDPLCSPFWAAPSGRWLRRSVCGSQGQWGGGGACVLKLMGRTLATPTEQRVALGVLLRWDIRRQDPGKCSPSRDRGAEQ